MMPSGCLRSCAVWRFLGALALAKVAGAVKELFSMKEFKDLMAEAGGRPVIIDYYSQSCGPCHMIAPVFRRISKQYAGRAYFRKVDVNRAGQISQAQGIRSMPTFQFWVNGKKKHTFSGADEGQLQQWTRMLVDQADRDDVVVSREDLVEFYKKHDPAKATDESIDKIIEKNSKDYGTMVKLLKKKYGEAPKTTPRPRPQKAAGGEKADNTKDNKGPGLQSASIEELRQELEKREEAAAEERIEEEERRLANNPCNLYRNRSQGATEKLVIIGGGPGGMTAAIYAARANLCPLLIAPPLGGQLMAKGVDVENYPGMPRANGGAMIQTMKSQARSFFAEVRDDMVLGLNTTTRPFEIYTNNSGTVKAHSIILSTGADSRWLHAEGEWDLRGNGVSACATCDGYLFKGKSCAVVGGGDTAMEESLFLSRICSKTTLIHRRDTFRASSVMQKRVLANSKIEVRWNTEIAKYISTTATVGDETRDILKAVMLKSTTDPAAEPTEFVVDAVFVAIGHDPNTDFVKGQLDMDESGYLAVQGRSTGTSVPGIFAAGDVADHTYRQAVTSAGSGSMAAIDAERYLSENLSEDEVCVRQEDFSSWSLKELRAQISLLGIKCLGCTDKRDFIDTILATY